MARDVWGPGKDFQSAGPIKTVAQLHKVARDILSCVQSPSKMEAAANSALRSPDYFMSRPELQRDLLDVQQRYCTPERRGRFGRANPATPTARRFVSAKIRKLRREGKPARAAVGEALAIGRRRGFRSLPRRPAKPNPTMSEKAAWQFVRKHAEAISRARLTGVDANVVKLLGLQLVKLADDMRAQLGQGIHTNPRRRANPVMGLIANESPAVFTVSKRVKEIVYIHAQDGEEYVHPFAPGVSATFLQDGRCVLWRRDGKPVGGRRIGNTIRPIGG